MVYKGINKINQIMLKNKKIAKAYLGNKLVYTSSILPSEYQQVEYIEGTGTQYINTGIKANGLTTNYETEFMPTSIKNGVQYIFSAKQARQIKRFDSGWNDDKGMWIAYNSGEVTKVTIEVKKAYNLKKNGDKIYFDNNLIATIATLADFETPVNIVLFANNTNGTINYQAHLRLYYFKLYNGNDLIRDFIPCYRKTDNVIGLYDIVNNVFYTNAGTGTFIKGSDV